MHGPIFIGCLIMNHFFINPRHAFHPTSPDKVMLVITTLSIFCLVLLLQGRAISTSGALESSKRPGVNPKRETTLVAAGDNSYLASKITT